MSPFVATRSRLRWPGRSRGSLGRPDRADGRAARRM